MPMRFEITDSVILTINRGASFDLRADPPAPRTIRLFDPETARSHVFSIVCRVRDRCSYIVESHPEYERFPFPDKWRRYIQVISRDELASRVAEARGMKPYPGEEAKNE